MNTISTFLGRFFVLAALITAPWANVGVDARNFRILIYLTLASGIFALISLWTTPRRERRTNSYWGAIATTVPLALGLALAVVQFLPLSEKTLARVSPRVLELKAELTPSAADSKAPSLDAFADPEFQAPAPLDEAEENALRESLSDPFPFDPETPLDLQSATAVDAAVEEAFLPTDAPARAAWGRTISVYPLATRQSTLIFGAALILFLSSVILFNSTAARRLLWSAVALNGLAVALFCLAGRVNPAIFENEAVADWLIEKRFTPFERFLVDVEPSAVSPSEYDWKLRARYGMYVCRNAAAGYLGLCFAAALGLVVSAFLKTARALDKERAERKRERAEEERWSDVYEARRDALWKRALGDFFDLFDRRFVFWACVAGGILGAIFASLSRGGSVAAFVGFLGALSVLAIRKEGRRYWPGVAALGLVALASILWFGLGRRVDARMSTLVEADVESGETAVESDGRWENWRAAKKTGRDYPWWGSGLGTYDVANYRNDESLKRGAVFFYAENSLVQTRLEMGRVGVVLFALTYVALLAGVGRLVVGRRSRETLAVGCVGICLIVGQFLASMGDFGVYFQANLFLFAALCGSCVARKNVRKWEKLEAALANPATRPQAVRDERRAIRSERGGAALTSAFLALLLLGGPWALAENADAVERARLLKESDAIKRLVAKVGAPNAKKKEGDFFFALPSSATLDATLDGWRAFFKRRDDSYEARVAAAELELARFRIVQYEAWRDVDSEATDEELWARTIPENWTVGLRHYRRLGFYAAAASIRSNEAIAETFPSLLTDWLAARRVCPLKPVPHLRIGEALAAATPIAWEREREAVELAARRAASAAPFNSQTLLAAGRELFRVDAEKLWPKFWRRTADFSNEAWLLTLNAVELGVPASKQEAVVAEIMPNDPTKARNALTRYFLRKNETPLWDVLLKNAAAVFEATPEEERNALYFAERAYFNKFSENFEAAEADFRKALTLAPGALDLELQLGILLCEQTRLLQKDAESVKLLRRVAVDARGSFKRQAETWLERAERNLLRSQARAKLSEKKEGENVEEPSALEPSSESTSAEQESAEKANNN